MQEFSSISVSSYDAAALTGRLTEASSEGWDVVAIVPAGTSVIAYLARASTGAPSSAATDATAATTTAGDDEFGFRLGSSGVPEAAAAETALSDDTATTSTGSPVEPAGWASEPEPAAPTPTPEPRPEVEPTPAAPVPTPDPDPTPEPDPAPAHAETQAAAEQAQAAAAPAGWYADPAGRYELRYWDGSQWTEHVSRAGQQYTDPPVA
ncbi:MAG: DUF2510 domain-containing protein [Ilumatobacteraceae bacterium]